MTLMTGKLAAPIALAGLALAGCSMGPDVAQQPPTPTPALTIATSTDRTKLLAVMSGATLANESGCLIASAVRGASGSGLIFPPDFTLDSDGTLTNSVSGERWQIGDDISFGGGSISRHHALQDQAITVPDACLTQDDFWIVSSKLTR